jgi:NAD(P)-dependent dehydrogenase (short-subunit alcohol dehydrogenase family)
MDGDASPWHGRRVLVAGCTGFLGIAVTRELVARGATVIGLVRDRSRAAVIADEIAAGTVRVVHGRVEDAARMHSAMAVHEVSAAFDFTGSDRGTTALLGAAALYHPRLPVVTARPANQLRINLDQKPPVPFGVARFGELAADAAADGLTVGDAARACLALAEALAADGTSRDITFRPGGGFAAAAPARRAA